MSGYLGVGVVPVIQQLVQFIRRAIHGTSQQLGGHYLLLTPGTLTEWLVINWRTLDTCIRIIKCQFWEGETEEEKSGWRGWGGEEREHDK